MDVSKNKITPDLINGILTLHQYLIKMLSSYNSIEEFLVVNTIVQTIKGFFSTVNGK